jgi:hypothetical protein
MSIVCDGMWPVRQCCDFALRKEPLVLGRLSKLEAVFNCCPDTKYIPVYALLLSGPLRFGPPRQLALWRSHLHRSHGTGGDSVPSEGWGCKYYRDPPHSADIAHRQVHAQSTREFASEPFRWLSLPSAAHRRLHESEDDPIGYVIATIFLDRHPHHSAAYESKIDTRGTRHQKPRLPVRHMACQWRP